MRDKTFIVKKEKAVVSIILNRPEKLNGISYDLLLELEEALNEIASSTVGRADRRVVDKSFNTDIHSSLHITAHVQSLL